MTLGSPWASAVAIIDGMIPWKQGNAVAQHWEGAKLMTTQGLGHGRILRDEAVIAAAADFIRDGGAEAS